MQIVLLGTAAGGGSPQWNCHCSVCAAVRQRRPGTQPRSQSSVAISADGRKWFLLNASPDLRGQLQAFPFFQPVRSSKRNSPLQGVLLTNADLDHTLGLLLMREGAKIEVHATPQVRAVLENDSAFGGILKSFCGINWRRPPRRLAPLLDASGMESGLLYQGLELLGAPPRFSKKGRQAGPGHSLGFQIVDQRTGGKLVFLPDVSALPPALSEVISGCDLLLFDGTFWSENEMSERGVGATKAAQMGHWPISGPQGSLRLLSSLRVPQKIYTHINNTNPILLARSAEYRQVIKAGLQVGRDGMQFTL